MEEKKGKIESFSSKSNNKIAYILLVEDLSVSKKFRAFVGDNPDRGASFLKMRGYEISWSKRDKIQSFDDALEAANSERTPEEMIEIEYPWQRVINLRNVCYKRKMT